jgi:hypothetical protein
MLVSPFLAFSSSVNGGGITGMIGLGRSPFEPLCAYACLSAFWGLRVPCTEVELATRTTGSNPLCHSATTLYLGSLAYCIQSKCAADKTSAAHVEKFWSRNSVGGIKVTSLEDNIPDLIPTKALPYNALVLNETSQVNPQYYSDSRTTIQGFVKQESAHALYG